MSELKEQLSDPTPEPSVLNEARRRSDALSVIVGEQLRRAAKSKLNREQTNLLTNGLYVCGEAAFSELWPDWVALMRCPSERLSAIFGAGVDVVATDITLSLFDVSNDTAGDTLLALLVDASICERIRRGLWRAAARLTANGDVDRIRFLTLAYQYPDQVSDDSLQGWADAVMLLDLHELAPILERLWARAPAFADFSEEGRESYRELMAQSFERFSQCEVSPVRDAASSLETFRAVRKAWADGH